MYPLEPESGREYGNAWNLMCLAGELQEPLPPLQSLEINPWASLSFWAFLGLAGEAIAGQRPVKFFWHKSRSHR